MPRARVDARQRAPPRGEFASYVEQFRGWGRGLRSGVRAWYENKTVGELAYQTVKYQDRAGFTHRDLMRLAHPVASDEARRALYAWIVRGTLPQEEPELALVRAFERAKTLADADVEVCATLVRETKLPREAVPTNWLREPAVWESLLETMPMTAAIRNLATMTRVGLLTPKSAATQTIVERLHDSARLKKARVHPVAILSALETYRAGRGVRGRGTWTPVDAIVEAVGDAFYLAFDAVEPSGARILVGLDVSGSMAAGAIAGVPGLTSRVASVAMAMTHLRSENNVRVMAFSNRFVRLDIERGDGGAGEAGDRRHDVNRLHRRRPKRRGHARHRRVRHERASADRRFRQNGSTPRVASSGSCSNAALVRAKHEAGRRKRGRAATS